MATIGGLLALASPAQAVAGPLLTGTNAHMNVVCTYDGAWIDDTTDSQDTDVADVDLGDDVLGNGIDTVYYGMSYVFKTIAINVGTPGVSGTVTWEYWNSNTAAWTSFVPFSDGTSNYQNAGTNLIVLASSPPMTNWGTTTVADCSATAYYYVRSTVGTDYTTIPRATQIGALEFNLKVKAQDELGTDLTGLAQTAFTVSAGTTNTVHAHREIGSGVYELALDTVGADRNFNVQTQKDGYVTSTAVESGTVSTTLTDISSSAPMSLKYAVKVTPDDEISGSSAFTGATVTTGNSFGVTCVEPGTPDGNYYCAVPLSHTGTDIKIAKDGYVTKTLTSAFTDRTANSATQRIAPERVKLIGENLPSATAYGSGAYDSTNNLFYYFGGNDGSKSNKIYRYNPTGNTVTLMSATLNAALEGSAAVWDTSNNVAYIFAGNDGAMQEDIWKYDPSTDTLTDTGYDLPSTTDHLCAAWDSTNNKAYVFGGWTVGPSTQIIRFTPGSGVATETATLPVGRTGCSAVYDGTKMWIFGGWGGAFLNDIIKWTPGENSASTSTTLLPQTLEDSSAVYDSAGGYAYIFGGFTGTAVTDDIVRFKPSDETIGTQTEALPSARKKTVAGWDSTNSRAYIMGGELASGRTDQIIRYTPASASVVTTPVLPSKRMPGAAVAQSSIAYIFGGVDGSTRRSDVVKFDPSTSVVTTLSATLPSAREGMAAASDGSNIYLFGGYDGSSYLNTILKYNPTDDTMTTLSATLPSGRSYATAVWDSVASRIYVFGGQTSGATFTTQILSFNPSGSGSIATLSATLPTAGAYMSSIFDGTNAYVFGGYANGASGFTTIVKYDPTAATVTTMTGTFAGRYWTSAVWDGSNAYVFGGTATDNDDILRYTPSTDTVTNMDTLYANDKFPYSRYATSATWDGTRTYVFGGYGQTFTGGTADELNEIVRYDRTLDLDLKYAVKVTGVASEKSSNNALSSVTVTTGDSFGTTCTESSSAWYCAVPLANTEVAVKAAKDGYVTKTASSAFTDRTAATDAQQTASVTGVQFAVKVTGVTTEGPAASLSTVTVTTGNSFGTSCTEDGSAWLCAVPLADTEVAVKASKDGYVTKTASSAFTDRTTATDAQQTATVSSVQFAYKVTGVTTEGPANSLTSVTIKAGNAQGTTCTESGGAWYCAVPLADSTLTIQAEKDGYVTDTGTSFGSDRTAATEAQVTAAVTGVKFAVKVTGVTTEGPGTSLSSVTVTTGNSFGISCSESGGAWYCAVPLADDGVAIRVAKDGYATKDTSSAFTDRTVATAAQATAAISGVQFAYKVTGVADELGTALSSVTVNAGNAQGTTCTESSGAWYCAVPLADDTLTIQAAKDGYVTNTGTSFGSDRTAATAAQVTASVSGVKFAYKITSVATEGSPAVTLTSGTVTTGNSFGTACTVSSGAWYCAVPLADTEVAVKFARDGYVTKTTNSAFTDRTVATAAQGTVAITGVQFTLKITITGEASLTGVVFEKKLGAGSYASITADTDDDANVAYFAQVSTEADVVYRITKATDLAETSTFTAAVTSQLSLAVDPVPCSLNCPMTDESASAASLVAGATTTYTFSFQTIAEWPNSASFTATFPSGYTFGTPVATIQGADGTWGSPVVDSSARTVKVARTGGTTTVAQTTITVILTNIINPPISGSSGTFGLLLETAGGSDIAIDTAPAVTITTGSLSSVSASAASLVAGATTTYTFAFTGANAWPATGQVVIVFPSAYTVPASPSCTLTGAAGSCSGSGSSLTVTVSRSSGSETAAGTAITVALGSITNPSISGSSGTFSLTTENSGGTDIDTGTASAVTITSGTITVTATASSYVASTQTTYTFSFTTVNAWPSTGKLTILFPNTYAIDSTAAATLTGASGSANVAVDGNSVTLTRSGGAQTAASTAVTVALTKVTNPSSTGSSGSFTLTLKTSGDTNIDTGVASAVTITSNSLAVSGLTSSSHPSGTWKTSTTLSMSWTAPSSAVSGYSWGLDADPDDTVDGTSTSASSSALSNGVHAFNVKAKSTGGSWGPIATYSNIYVDGLAPSTPSISSSSHAAGACTVGSSGTFTWGAGDDHSGLHSTQPYGYALDGGSETRTSASGYTATGLADGSHSLKVTAYDVAGNSASTTYAFKVDSGAPTTSLSGAPSYTNSTSISLSWSASESCGTTTSVTIEWRFNDGAWTTHSSIGTSTANPSGTLSVTLSGGDGTYGFRASATDSAGNVGTMPVSAQATTVLDRVAPGAPANVNAIPQPQGYIKVTWSAASDDRSGVQGYNVYRVDESGARVKVNAALVAATEYTDGPYAHGYRLKYEVKAQDKAGNLGAAGATPGTTQSRSQGPSAAPTGLTVVGLQKDMMLLAQPQVLLQWDPVPGVYGYAIYRDGVQIGTSLTNAFEAADAPDGSHTYTVVAVDDIGNEGPPAALTFLKDALPPSSRASSPPESGPAVVVTWTAQDAGIGVVKVELWVLQENLAPKLFYQSSKASGSISFYGVEGNTYYFTALATDGLGHAEVKTMRTSSADASTRVVSSLVQANADAVSVVSASSGGGSSAFRSDGAPRAAFYAEDTDKDGFPETFVDPSGGLAPMQIIPVDGVDNAFLIGASSGGGGGDVPVALWSPATGAAYPVTIANPIEPPTLMKDEAGRFVKSVKVDKGGWIYISVDDDHPDLEIESVRRADNSALPPGYYWRQNGKVIVMDDPSYEYRIVYLPLEVEGIPVWLVALLVAGLITGLTAGWVVWPSVERLGRRPIHAGTLRWALRYCAECRSPLARLHRLVRRLHACAGLALRLAAHQHWWQTTGGLAAKLTQLGKAIDRHGWLFPHSTHGPGKGAPAKDSIPKFPIRRAASPTGPPMDPPTPAPMPALAEPQTPSRSEGAPGLEETPAVPSADEPPAGPAMNEIPKVKPRDRSLARRIKRRN